MKRPLLIILALLSLAMAAQASCPVIKLDVERLPDMNVARAGHCAFCIDGEIVVMGGHTAGFKPTQTAEYFAGGKWHTMNMVYEHDNATAVQLLSGKVLLAGGSEKPLGIGQTYPTELYDPATHTFEGFGCLFRKRTQASATVLPDGRTVIAGNWYRSDMIECYDGKASFDSIKPTTASRVKPAILLTAPDDAIILGYTNSWGKHYPDSADIVDRLQGDAVHIPLLKSWHINGNWIEGSSFIGDEKQNDYTYLLGMTNDQGEMAIVRIHNGEFSLLPTDHPVPSSFNGEKIDYVCYTLIDRKAKRAYLIGWAKKNVIVLAIDYAHPTATLTLYYTESKIRIPIDYPVITSEGNIVLTGGIFDSNFYPQASVFVLHTGTPYSATSLGWKIVIWSLAALMTVTALGVWLLWRRRSKAAPAPTQDADATSEGSLMDRVTQLMETEHPYLRCDLKVADVAAMLSVSNRCLSEAINAHLGCSFTQFVNSYRIGYAQQLLDDKPDMKVSAVALESGFANETSFFRTFKAHTGMTPKEWLSRRQNHDYQNEKSGTRKLIRIPH
ncbi:MAG: helix-turn-helix domain-containing protein [Muribaculaceae bacterium]|nr:helix-turn-helix domain-containing protein [Muribaculaceae bacterium]